MRAPLDRICDEAPSHLRPEGVLLIVHSEACDPRQTLDRLRAGGPEVDVIARHHGPLGPLLRARPAKLEARGVLAQGQREEELLVVRGAA